MKKLIYIASLFFILSITTNTSVFAQCTINDATDCECLNPNETDCDLLPDIQLSWFGILDVSDGPSEYPQTGAGSDNGRLRISASTPNDGVGPLTVRGVDGNGWAYFICGDDTIIETDPSSNLSGYYCDDSDEPARQITFQRIYHRNSDGTMSYYDRMAGSMTYHPTHGHNHSDDWGVFTLRVADENEPNPLNWPIVSDGAKMGFCLMDYGTCGTGNGSTYYGHCRDENRYSPDYLELFPEFDDGSNGGNIKLNSDYPNFGLGGGNYGCSPIEQGISAGWLDLYGEWLDDQWINLEPGICNGIYWIIGEVDRNNDYLESNEDNNWTAVQVELTQQLDGTGYSIEIVTDQDGNPNICDGETITLNPSSFTAEEYLWSNGETTPSIEVNESGEYSLTTVSACGEGQSQAVTVLVNPPIEIPIVNDVTIQMGESATLNASGNGNIIWQNENGDFLGEGTEFISEPLYENTTFYVVNEDVLVQAPATLSTGALEHEGSSDYSGSVYNGGLLFDCIQTFTLNSVKVYADEEGERTIELHNADGDIINDLLVNIPATNNDGYIIDLNWEITPGDQYLLTTNTQMNNDNFGDNNPMLKRTTDGLPEFPYSINNILTITEGYYDGGAQASTGSSEDYYYYFYDWQINNDWGIGGSSCLSDVVSVNVFVNNNNTVINENNNTWLNIYPNPANNQLNIIFNNAINNNTIILFDHLGKVCDNIQVQNIAAGGKITIDVSNLSSGLYFIHLINDNISLKQSFTVNK
ncbi:MAG: hypothetical protein CMP50_01190 [Flavobacteriales bacterium]|nr:hypothetical protein [Flavobacteriales bacterium]